MKFVDLYQLLKYSCFIIPWHHIDIQPLWLVNWIPDLDVESKLQIAKAATNIVLVLKFKVVLTYPPASSSSNIYTILK